MEAMKRVILILLLLILLPLPQKTANAEELEQYAVADSKDVWLYSAENEESGLFLLPYTYYVKILRRGTVFSYVQYLVDEAPYRSVTGYCKTDELLFVDFVPVRPYLKREISVSYSVENPSGMLMGKGSFDKVTKSFVYYGVSYLGTARFYYVFADGVFDYIPATQEVVFELNTDYLSSPSGEIVEEPTPKKGLSGVQIAILCAAGVSLLSIALFLLRGKKPAPSQESFEF